MQTCVTCLDEFENREVMHETLNALAKSIEERAYASQNTAKKPRVVVCECGAKILLVPDLNEMGRSIERHALKHQKKESTQEKPETDQCRIELLLAQRVLQAIAGFGAPQ